MSNDSDTFGSGVWCGFFIVFIVALIFGSGVFTGIWWTASSYRACVNAGATMERCVYIYVQQNEAKQ